MEMLMVRDKLMQLLDTLTPAEKTALSAADKVLYTHAAEFYSELSHITNLEYERQQRQPAPGQWWWFLDVLLEAPYPSHGLHETAIEPA
jgi:hypothetical protein